jgi:hypothetical protein
VQSGQTDVQSSAEGSKEENEADLAMTLVNHVLPDSLHALVLLPLPVAVKTDVSDSDLLREVEDETGQVDKVLAIGNEEAMGELHVADGVLGCGKGLMGAKEARGRGKTGSGESDSGVDGRLDGLLVSVFGDGEGGSGSGGGSGSSGGGGSGRVVGIMQGLIGGVDGSVGVVRRNEVGRSGLNERSRSGLVFRSSGRVGGRGSRVERGDLARCRGFSRGLLGRGSKEGATEKTSGLLELGVSMLLGLDVGSVRSLRGKRFAAEIEKSMAVEAKQRMRSAAFRESVRERRSSQRATYAQRVQVSPCLVAVTAFSFRRSMTFRLKRAAVTGGRVATLLYNRTPKSSVSSLARADTTRRRCRSKGCVPSCCNDANHSSCAPSARPG